MNSIQIFNFNSNEVRTTMVDGVPYFIGKDVAIVLGYTNTRKALNDHVDEEDKGVTKCDTLGGKQDMTIINESGMYSLVLSSKLPQAKQFKRWVTSEVLPQIRKTGAYALPQSYTEALAQLLEHAQENEKLKLENKAKSQVLSEMKPKADYVDNILKSKALMTVTAIAKDYGMTSNELNKLLHDEGIQYKQSNQWFLYWSHQDKGLTQSETVEITKKDGTTALKFNTKWTQKGRLFIHELLKSKGIKPNIEKH